MSDVGDRGGGGEIGEVGNGMPEAERGGGESLAGLGCDGDALAREVFRTSIKSRTVALICCKLPNSAGPKR